MRIRPVEEACGLRVFAHGVSAGAEIAECVGAVRVCEERRIHQRTEVVGAREPDGNAADAGFPAIDRAIVIVVAIDRAAEGAGGKFAKVVAGANRVCRERDILESVVDRRAGAGRPLRINAIIKPSRLSLRDRVSAGPQIRKRVSASARRRGAKAHGFAKHIRACERHRHAVDRRVHTVDQPVIIQIAIRRAGERGGEQFTKVVVGPDVAADGNGQRSNRVRIQRRAHRAAEDCADGFQAIHKPSRLRLGDRVIAAWDCRE